MEADDAEALRREWGTKPCTHPETEPETYLASPTGDDVCVQCGAVVRGHSVPTRHSFRPQG